MSILDYTKITFYLARIANALEIIAGIKEKPDEKSNEKLDISVVEVTEEDIYQEERNASQNIANEKMDNNPMKSLWAEDNLSADDLGGIE